MNDARRGAPPPPEPGMTDIGRMPTDDLIEQVSAAVHDAWIAQQRRDGNTSRISKGGEEMMVPYARLSESCKEYDRVTVRAVLGALPALGYAVVKAMSAGLEIDRLRPSPDEAARLREAATLVVARMPRRPMPDEDGATPGVYVGPGAPVWDAVDDLRAAFSSRPAPEETSR